MGKKPVLVVMAAGMGSRYGGLKQIDAMGSCGEAILDYSLYDAHEAGFETAVIIIKKAIEADFMETVGKRLKKCPMEIRYVFQELDKIPAGCTVPAGRTKPWGTSHAVLCAREAIGDARFAVVNADVTMARPHTGRSISSCVMQRRKGRIPAVWWGTRWATPFRSTVP